MRAEEAELSERLVRIYENVLLTEEQALSKGYFSDLSNVEMHTLDAIGPYEARTMTETANDLGHDRNPYCCDRQARQERIRCKEKR